MAKTTYNQKITNFFAFIALLRVEPYMFVFAFSAVLRQTPLSQLIQDKICIQQFNESREYCRDIARMDEKEDKLGLKSSILGNAVQYNLYQSLITTCPAIVISIFLGSFVDNFKQNGNKILLLIGSVTSSCEALLYAFNSIFFDMPVNYVLFSFIPYSFSGLMVYNTCFAYVAATTPTNLKAIRLMILEVCILLSTNLGQALSGSLLLMRIFGPDSQLHNYTAVFLICLACNLFTILWTMLFINQQRDKLLFELKFTKINPELKINGGSRGENNIRNLISLLFSFTNIKEMIRSVTRKRHNKIRLQLWLVNIALCLFYVGVFSPRVFQFQFMQKVYYWDAELYGYFTSLTTVSQAITILVITPLLIKVYKLNDMTLAIIGFTGSFLQNIMCGVLLKPLGFYISLFFGSTARLGSIGYKTHLAKIVDIGELGKVNTFLSLIDALAPIIASLFSVLFKLTIDSYPGLCYLVLSALLLVPIYIAIWIDLYSKSLPDKTQNIYYVTKL